MASKQGALFRPDRLPAQRGTLLRTERFARRLQLAGFPDCFFELQGNLTTHRTRFRLPDGLRMDFDVNFYEGRTDYELELEFRPEARERARLLLRELGVSETTAGRERRLVFSPRGRENRKSEKRRIWASPAG